MTANRLLVTYDADASARAVISDTVGASVEVTYLPELDDGSRAAALRGAQVLLARNTTRELREGEAALLGSAKLLQFVTAGVDFIPLGAFPESLPIAVNAGGYSEPMAEHGLAMALAAGKRLFIEHRNLERGEFNQFIPNRLMAGQVAGILGYGGIGKASARLFRALGMAIHAINRRGVADESVDWMGKTADLDTLLTHADVLLLSLPLTHTSRGLLGARELSLMKPDAILVNLARGEIIDEAALYQHLVEHPQFTACIDAWWIEPVRHGEFRMDQPFMQLPNVVASPHNSATTGDWLLIALRRAVENCARVFNGEAPTALVGPDEHVA